MLDKRNDSYWLTPVTKGDAPHTVSEVLSALKDPIVDIGKEIHTQFSGINLRGLKTHNVVVRRTLGQQYDSELSGVAIGKNSMALLVDLTAEEIASAGPTLQLFTNELQIERDVRKGIIILHGYDQNVEDCDNAFSVGLIIDDEAVKSGKSGILFPPRGYVGLIPKVRAGGMVPDPGFRSDLEKKSDTLLHDLVSARSGDIIHPLVARATYEAAYLVGKAVFDRKLDSSVFKTE